MTFKDRYINGNYIVDSRNFGRDKVYKALRINENFEPDFPDSIDLKITNKCSHGCSFCHESSEKNGKSFNLERTCKMLDELPNRGIEIAIGGGNVFECFSDFKQLLEFCHSKKFYTRATINIADARNLDRMKNDLLPLICDFRYKMILGAFGISVTKFKQVQDLYDLWLDNDLGIDHSHVVYHIILGVFPPEEISDLLDFCMSHRSSLLILGFKQFGRAKDTELPNLEPWIEELKQILYRIRLSGKTESSIGFDNLAIEQLQLKNYLLKSEWDSYYLGDEFTHTMYVDAVEETFAPTSRTKIEDRVSWSEAGGILNYFKNNRNPWK